MTPRTAPKVIAVTDSDAVYMLDGKVFVLFADGGPCMELHGVRPASISAAAITTGLVAIATKDHMVTVWRLDAPEDPPFLIAANAPVTHLCVKASTVKFVADGHTVALDIQSGDTRERESGRKRLYNGRNSPSKRHSAGNVWDGIPPCAHGEVDFRSQATEKVCYTKWEN